MDSRDMWERQVMLLTEQVQFLTSDLADMKERMKYFENVIITLLTALKDGGVIVDSDDGYEFN